MYHDPTQMEPLFPGGAEHLRDLAVDIVRRSAALGGQLHPITRTTISRHLRIINSYYSNLIEGHSTHPADIERAMRKEYAKDPAKRALQRESLAHIKVQQEVEERSKAEPELNIAEADFLQWVHRRFYEGLPDEFRKVTDPQTREEFEVIPGELRRREVEVGRHIAPRHDTLGVFLNRFASFYHRSRFHGADPVIAAAAAHHRLMWIHPFLDGNGRVARLFTDAYLTRVPVDGHGLWTVSRGLARRRDDYMAALTWGDARRENDYDGRGNLSNKGLIHFCEFFLEICLDQIHFMNELLQLDSLLDRIRGYVELRKSKVIAAPTPDYESMKLEMMYLLQEVMLRGEMTRGEAARATGLPERTARIYLKQLLDEGLLMSESAKGRVHLGLPTHVSGYWFPNLYPEQLVST